jgi:hypothetical protein
MSATSAAKYLMNDYQGIVLDPAGDWVELTREELEQVALGSFK